MAVRAVDGLSERGTVLRSAEDRHGQILKRRPGPFPWMLQQIAGIHLALGDAVPDLRPRQLHDHVGGAGGESPEIHGLGRGDLGGRIPTRGAPADVDAAVSGCHARHTVDSQHHRPPRSTRAPDTARSRPCLLAKSPEWVSAHSTPMTQVRHCEHDGRADPLGDRHLETQDSFSALSMLDPLASDPRAIMLMAIRTAMGRFRDCLSG